MTTHHTLRTIPNLRGDCGENAATVAIAAVLSTSPHYPDGGRIIVGAPETSESEIGGFSGGPEAIAQLADALAAAVAEVDAAMDGPPPLLTESMLDRGGR